MFVKAVEVINKSIFPIVTGSKSGNITNFSVLGTGFFVNDGGNFVTATHLLDNIQGVEIFKLANISGRNFKFEKIEILAQDKIGDIMVGEVKTTSEIKPVVFSSSDAPVGKSVCIAGYILGGFSKQFYQPSMVVDDDQKPKVKINVTERHYDGFLLSEPGINGLSGGPVFDTDAKVYGMQALTASRQSKNLVFHNALAIKRGAIKKFLDENEISVEVSEPEGIE